MVKDSLDKNLNKFWSYEVKTKNRNEKLATAKLQACMLQLLISLGQRIFIRSIPNQFAMKIRVIIACTRVGYANHMPLHDIKLKICQSPFISLILQPRKSCFKIYTSCNLTMNKGE